MSSGVSIHARAKRATAATAALAVRIWFQSTPARSGRLGGRRMPARGPRCFNPRPREAGDPKWSLSDPDAWRVSIHARAKRATPFERIRNAGSYAFQSTPARSGRPRATAKLILHTLVSIHARAKRATSP